MKDYASLIEEYIDKYGIVDKDLEEEKKSKTKKKKIYSYNPERVYAVVDLHKKTRLEVEPILKDLIATAYHEGDSIIKIIHGKGKHSGGRSVIRDEVIRLLNTTFSRYVEHFEFAKKEDGGSGATIVWLKV